MSSVTLEFRNIKKRFGNTQALKDVSLSVNAGEILSLVGENGAGKSTLMKILTGVYVKDEGDIYIDGHKEAITNPARAKALGISQVYQQAELIPELSVGENVLIGEEGFGQGGFYSVRKSIRKAQEVLDHYGIPIDASVKLKSLSVANQQMVAIAKVIQRDLKVLILDEPTAVLSTEEIELLFQIVAMLKKKNVAIIYISHKLDEVFRISDRIAVLRDGELITVLENRDLEKDDLISHMLGRRVEKMYPPKLCLASGENILEVKGITTDKVKDASFSLKKGEILGLAGLVGSGRTELARAVYGMDPVKKGTVLIDGQEVRIKDPADAVSHGMFLAPEDRRGQALVLVRSIRDNIILSGFGKVSRLGWCNDSEISRVSAQMKTDLNIKAENTKALTGSLSGGNQQKVVIAKAIMADPSILILDEPTQGIDVGAKSEIYFLMQKLVKEGMSILFISSELEELQGVCTRVLVMHDGKISGEVSGDDVEDSAQILNLMYRSVN